MKTLKNTLIITVLALFFSPDTGAQKSNLLEESEKVMLKSTRYMVEEVSTNGGYVWFYLPDFSRRWGEMEAYETMIWVQSPGTISMGHLFLDAYQATGEEYYYQAAEKAAFAIIWGQNPEGGWNYIIDFAGDRSLKHWYNTIGKNGWRLEEFQHYYGNSTFDDDVSSNAALFLLRMYVEKLDPVWKPALDKAINFVLESQYPLGGWPQRYPLKYDFGKKGNPDYTSFSTFNDGVVWENVNFLIQCYVSLGQEKFLDPIRRGMNFYIISQHGSGGWAQQLTLDLEPAGARTYEPKALLPSTSFGNAMLLLKFYQYTGDSKFLIGVPRAIEWLKQSILPEEMAGRRHTHSTFVEVGTNKPLFVHRKGSNSKYGYYYVDYNDEKLLSHYGGKTQINIDYLEKEYLRVSALSAEEATENSPLKVGASSKYGNSQRFINPDFIYTSSPDEKRVKEILQSLDPQGRWLVKNGKTSNPYIGDGWSQDLTDEYASRNVGDDTDTSPFNDPSDQEYLSTGEYINNMHELIRYVRSQNK